MTMVLRSLTAEQDLTANPLDVSFEFSRAGRLASVYVKCSANTTETITVGYDSREGSDYDTCIVSETWESQQNYVYAASGEVAFNEGDKVRVQCTNANTTGTVRVTVKLWN